MTNKKDMEKISHNKLLSLIRTFSQKWCAENDQVYKCYLVELPEKESFYVKLFHKNVCLVKSTIYETKEEALSSLRQRKEETKREEEKAIKIVARIIRTRGWEFLDNKNKNDDIREILDWVTERLENKFFFRHRICCEYISNGIINISGRAFKKEEVSCIRYGENLIRHCRDSAPIEITLKNGDKLTTTRQEESYLLQAIFGENNSDRIFPNIKWPNPEEIERL